MLSFKVRYLFKKDDWQTFIKYAIKIEQCHSISAPLPGWGITQFSNYLDIQAYAKIGTKDRKTEQHSIQELILSWSKLRTEWIQEVYIGDHNTIYALVGKNYLSNIKLNYFYQCSSDLIVSANIKSL